MKLTDRPLQAASGNRVLLRVDLEQRARAKAPPSETPSEPGTRSGGGGSGFCRDACESQGSLDACGVRRHGIAELQESLEALKELYCKHTGMEAVLKVASRLVVQIVNLEHCSIGWFDRHELGFRVRVCHTREGADVNPDQVAYAFSDLARRKRQQSDAPAKPSRGFATPSESEQAYELTAPLRMDRQIVGYLYGLRSRLSNSLCGADRSLFNALSQHISAAIEAQRAREMLNCQYLAAMLDAQDKLSFLSGGTKESAILESGANPQELARRIGRGLFGDLHRAGFETRQILCVVSEIIDSVNGVLRNTNAQRQSS